MPGIHLHRLVIFIASNYAVFWWFCHTVLVILVWWFRSIFSSDLGRHRASLGTPANFNGFRVLAALLHGTLVVVGVSQTLRRWTQGATYIRQGSHHVGHRPKFRLLSPWHTLSRRWYKQTNHATISMRRWLRIKMAAQSRKLAMVELSRQQFRGETTTRLTTCIQDDPNEPVPETTFTRLPY